jgi:hypothetical protein
MKPLAMSVWTAAAASSAVPPRRSVQARVSFSPAVKKLTRSRAAKSRRTTSSRADAPSRNLGVEVLEQALQLPGLGPQARVARLGLLGDALEPALHVLAVGEEELERERHPVLVRVARARPAVEDDEERIGLPQVAEKLGSRARDVDHAHGRRRHLLRLHHLRNPVEPLVRDGRHGDVLLGAHRRAGPGERVEEGRLPRVREADDADPERHQAAPASWR